MSGELVPLFESHLKVISALTDDLKENPTTSAGDGMTLSFFWTKICLAVQGVSKDATNLCMTFSGPPLPSKEECEPVVRKLEQMVVSLVSVFYSLPISSGLTLKRHVHTAVMDIVRAVHGLGQTIHTHDFNMTKEQLQKTGSVWDCCDQFPSLPRDNMAAILCDIKQHQGLVEDALQEMEETQQLSDGGDDAIDDFSDVPQWSDQEKLVMAPSLGLVKATKAALKKVSGVVKNQGGAGEGQDMAALDELNERLRGTSPGVDEVVSCLYPPIDQATLRLHVKELAVLLENVLEFLRSSALTTDTDETWLNFLTQAVHHNHDKLKLLIPGD